MLGEALLVNVTIILSSNHATIVRGPTPSKNIYCLTGKGQLAALTRLAVYMQLKSIP